MRRFEKPLGDMSCDYLGCSVRFASFLFGASLREGKRGKRYCLAHRAAGEAEFRGLVGEALDYGLATPPPAAQRSLGL